MDQLKPDCMNPDEFARLIQAAKLGDRDAQDAIVREFTPLVRNEVADLLPNSPHMSVRDSVQEVWMKVWTKVPTFRGSADPDECLFLFRAWLRQVSRNVAIDILRKENAAKNPPENEKEPLFDFPGDDRTPSSYANARSQAARLRDAIDRMDPLDAEVMKLRFLEGLTVREVAERLGLTVDQVRTIIDRGIKRLGWELDDK